MKITWTCMDILMFMSVILITETEQFVILPSGVSETSLCPEHRKQNQLPKAQKCSGPLHSPPLLQVPDDCSFSKPMGQGTDVSFSLNFFKKPAVTKQVWSCCGFFDIITQCISISKLMVLIFRIKFWNQGFSSSRRNYFP